MGKKQTVTSKERLINSAKLLMWQNSYHQVSVDMICKHADVQKGSFYHYFSSKSDLGIEALEDHYEEFRPLMDKIFSASIPPQARYVFFAQAVYDIQKTMSDDCGCVCGVLPVTIGVEIAGQDQEMRDAIRDILKRYEMYHQSALRDLIATGEIPDNIDVEDMAGKIHSFVVGCLIMARINNSLSTLKIDMTSGIFDILNIAKNNG
ncbi:MAG: TetR/AcrR family transcriptional regulator [Alcanivorax sp.]